MLNSLKNVIGDFFITKEPPRQSTRQRNINDWDDDYDEDDEDGYDDEGYYNDEPEKPQVRVLNNNPKDQRKKQYYQSEHNRSFIKEFNPIADLISVSLTDLADAALICDFIVDQHICVVNLTDAVPDVAQRIVDILYGSAYTQGYHIQTVDNRILILSPKEINIENNLRRTKSKGDIYRNRKDRAQ